MAIVYNRPGHFTGHRPYSVCGLSQLDPRGVVGGSFDFVLHNSPLGKMNCPPLVCKVPGPKPKPIQEYKGFRIKGSKLKIKCLGGHWFDIAVLVSY